MQVVRSSAFRFIQLAKPDWKIFNPQKNQTFYQC